MSDKRGGLDLLVGKIASWWQPPLGIAATIAVITGALVLVQRLGPIH